MAILGTRTPVHGVAPTAHPPVRRVRGIAYGHRIEVEVPDQFADSLLPRLPCGWTQDETCPELSWRLGYQPGAGWQAYREGHPLSRGESGEAALDRLVVDVERWVAEHAEGLTFVTAGAVAWRGRVIAVPGQRLAGKTTLVAALVRAGATYFSDEFAVLSPDGLVHPYPRPLSLRPPDGGPGRPTWVTDLGGVAATAPLPLGLVADLAYSGSGGWRVDRLSRGRTALALIGNSVAARARPDDVYRTVQACVEGAEGISGTRDGAHQTCERLLHGEYAWGEADRVVDLRHLPDRD